MQLRTSIIGATAALAIVPAGSALAATITGGPGNERLRGTSAADVIDANAGNDRIWGRGGGDQLTGGPGYDRLFGGAGNDALRGGDARDHVYGGSGNDNAAGENGNDLMAGGTGDDTQDGGPGNDRIYANLGVDTTYGGDGNDDLWALARGDVRVGGSDSGGSVDQTGDTLVGGAGDDRFHTRDGEVDRITCGDGTDRALLDRVDVITDATAQNPNGSCEKVARRAPKPRESKSEDAQQARASAKS
jgi:Ca2+-binding RTX toxin-like protein